MSDMDLIKYKIESSLTPLRYELIDESHLHAGHAGAKQSGGGHYKLRIISSIFEGKSLIERHRIVYDVLANEMKTLIHALAIKAYTPKEWKDD